MPQLPQTSQALYEFRAQHQLSFGSHMGEKVATGVPGIPVGEVPFDPSRHEVDAINPLSPMEAMLDVPYVTQVIPYRPIEMSVVLHQEAANRQVRAEWMGQIATMKRDLADGLSASIENSGQPNDRGRVYIVGEGAEDVEGFGMTEVIPGTKDPEDAAEAIAEIAAGGNLTVVVSDFRRLPLSEVDQANFGNTVGVKVNHPLELELPADVGRVSLGGLNEVNTDNAKQLAQANEELERVDSAVRANLAKAGLVFAQVVFDPESAAGFNIMTTDRAIATAVNTVNRG